VVHKATDGTKRALCGPDEVVVGFVVGSELLHEAIPDAGVFLSAAGLFLHGSDESPTQKSRAIEDLGARIVEVLVNA
jgi:hypothetical protein